MPRKPVGAPVGGLYSLKTHPRVGLEQSNRPYGKNPGYIESKPAIV
jgi:hypothetical protein